MEGDTFTNEDLNNFSNKLYEEIVKFIPKKYFNKEYIDEMLDRYKTLKGSNYNMKYRVKFKCYWYNTGSADNHTYIKHEDFDTEEEAIIFKQRVDARDKTIKIENGFIDGDGEIVRYYPAREEPI